MNAHAFDAITADDLRRAGSLKWTAYPDALGAWVAEADFPVAPPIAAALHDAVDRGLLGYLPPDLVRGTSEAYASFAADRYGWTVDPARVRPASDVLTVLEHTIRHFSRPGSPVIVPTPSYMPFHTLPGELGREVLQVPMVRDEAGRYTYDLDALDAAFAAGGHLMIVCNPHNPIGRVLEPAEMLAVAEVVDRHGGRVFSDEIHAPLVHPGRRHVPYASLSETTAGHTLTATSASKAWNLPGLKCAQVVLSNDADVKLWDEVGERVEEGASTLGILAGGVAYAEGREWLDDVLPYVQGNAARLGELLAGSPIGYRAPEGTYLAWLDCRGLDLPGDAATYFRERAGVVLVDGADCGDAGRGFVRFNLGLPRPLLEQAVGQMLESLPA
ncbi:MalY/PatB family protein [Promicromonospora thailandica]|uniref:cysteine-S-conjugate beta-lyase n=1 Tax=Promicromonospora thailandica TaxID=765201 RepID=A0A9X2G3W0_9MICO|nr:aminotransferase class I/II-fold pyridoxal phosphate-dependent enzyme [Promicromonospora thailandica]MCP2264852.1 cystathione beta-lyase [Promicromonospora thailandica]BFF18891.1 aminotransferase class I/II-fold pyridoxal phosphate-dependent enzyme [Promicromonospora thailandica]